MWIWEMYNKGAYQRLGLAPSRDKKCGYYFTRVGADPDEYGPLMEVIEEVPAPLEEDPGLQQATPPPTPTPTAQPPGAPKLQRRPPPSVGAFGKFFRLFRRKTFYDSRDLRYIDEVRCTTEVNFY